MKKTVETFEFVLRNRLYRLTAHPSVEKDQFSMVEVLIPESINRRSHFRRLKHNLRTNQLRDYGQKLHALKTTKEKGAKSWPIKN